MPMCIRRLSHPLAFLLLICVALCLSAFATDNSKEATTLVFMNVNVVPMNREGVLERQRVLVRDGRIVAIGVGDSVEIPANARRIEAAGRYLIPGLTDAH